MSDNLVYIVQMLRADGAVIGAPLALFDTIDKANRFASRRGYSFSGISMCGYVYTNEYNHKLVIITEVVK